MINFCPKLDQGIDDYVDKLTALFKDNTVKSITIVHMEVPCCGGTASIIKQALENAQKEIPIKDVTISVSGEILEEY